MKLDRPDIIVRPTRRSDFVGIQEMSRLIYPDVVPWSVEQLESHLRVFPEGQLVAVEGAVQRVVGMAASLIVRWDDYLFDASWRSFTDRGLFTNHDREHGRTLYGADVMVHPNRQRRGIGKKLYEERRQICRKLNLLRIRAGARLRNYHLYASQMSADEYVQQVVAGKLKDPTLTFQLREGFHVIGVVGNYIVNDPESMGYAAIIEWLNHAVARKADYVHRDRRFLKPRKTTQSPGGSSGSPSTPAPMSGKPRI